MKVRDALTKHKLLIKYTVSFFGPCIEFWLIFLLLQKLRTEIIFSNYDCFFILCYGNSLAFKGELKSFESNFIKKTKHLIFEYKKKQEL